MVPSYIPRPLPNGLSFHDILEIIRYLISLVLPKGLTVHNLRELIRRIANRIMRKAGLAAGVNMSTGNRLASSYHRLDSGVRPPVVRRNFLRTVAPIVANEISRSLPNKYRSSTKSKEIPLGPFAQSPTAHGRYQEGPLRPRNGRQ